MEPSTIAQSPATGAAGMLAQAQLAATEAARRAGVRLAALTTIEEMREASGVLEAVWGRAPEGAPIPSEMLRSLVHADGLVSGARDATGGLAGVAVLGRAAPGSAYSYIAAARPGAADSGIGFALKQHQRAWGLATEVTRIRWTFDPLVSRNARFNLTKLGATTGAYEAAFYGQMSDDLNGVDVADRLVADWRLDSARAAAASEGDPVDDPAGPPTDALATALPGPDGEPAWIPGEDRAWCRVPTDVVALRRSDPALASAWRDAVAGWLAPAFADDLVADGLSRSGWYRLTKENR